MYEASQKDALCISHDLTHPPHSAFIALFLSFLALLPISQTRAANVNPGTGYTNDFSSQPAAADWTTRSFGTGSGSAVAGLITTVDGLNSAVQTNSADLFSAQCASSSSSPPSASGTAAWSTSGYLQTRPTAVAATLLMARFVNNTGTNALGVHINYDYTTNLASAVTEEVLGHLIYYSLSGAANSWSNITAFSQAPQGALSADLTLSEVWSNGATLYLLWADDNGSGSPDIALDIDNFYIAVNAPAIIPAYCALTSPANGQSFGAVAAVTLAASASGGEGVTITGVGLFDISGICLDSFANPPYSITTNLDAGAYTFYAVATNNLGEVMFSGTNTITVTNVPFSVALTNPANGISAGAPAIVNLQATIIAGTGATDAGLAFYEFNNGFLGSVLSAPYNLSVNLDAGVYQFYAIATNSLGAIAFSATNTMTVTNVPFTVTLIRPANGAAFTAPATVALSAAVIPGTEASAQSVAFYDVTRGFLTNTLVSPFSNNVVLGAGAYAIYAIATNSLNAVAYSVTNTITVTLVGGVNAGTGYTNDFSSQPIAAEWSTRSFFTTTGSGSASEITTVSGLDAAVQTNTASIITAQCASATGTPPTANSNAVWSSAGGYLQTRPTQAAATLLMARFVNNTGTNALGIHINYDYTTNRATPTNEEVLGQLVYYSFSGAANSWSNIAALSQAPQGTLSVDLTLSGVWTNGTPLYLLWADDNASSSPDVPLDIDNFYIAVNAPAIIPAYCALISPANGQSFGAVAAVTLNADAAGGEGADITGVGFYEITAGYLGSTLNSPYSITTNLVAGSYGFYAVATNSLGAVMFSGTNIVTVTNVLFSVALTNPANGTSTGAPATVNLQATMIAGTGATDAGLAFYEVANGFLGSDLSAPYSLSVNLDAGIFKFYAVATNNLGATAVSLTNIITITNVPLSVTLNSPANGTVYGVEAAITYQATTTLGSSGSAIDSVSFYLLSNGIASLLVTDTTAPYSNQLSSLPEGTYGIFAIAANHDAQTAVSRTNTISVSSIVSGTILRGPYMGSRGETNITIRWRTLESTIGRVRYGTNPASLIAYTDDTTNGTNHSVTLTGLVPETKYYYSLGTSAGTVRSSTNYYFSTAPQIGSTRSTRIWFLSDYGQADTMEATVRDTYLNFITTNGRGTDVWLTGGDNEQTGTTGADAAYQTSLFNVLSNVLQNTPIFPTPGNHDGGTSSAYWNIFDLPYQGQAGGYPSDSPHFYSFDYANIHFISLDPFNSATNSSSPMFMWITNDLARTTQKWIIAYFHAPIYCKVQYDSDTLAQSLAMRTNFAPVLEAYGVDLILSGHSHTHQRSYFLNGYYGLSTDFSTSYEINSGNGRIDGTGAYVKTNRQGCVYCVAPTGCSITRSTTTPHPACLYTINNTAGFLTIDINSNRLDFQMISSSGAVSDYFTILKPESATNALFAVVPALTNGICNLVIQGTPGATYTLQFTESLGSSWQKRVNVKIPSEGVARVQDDSVSATNRFYRLIYPAQ
jgi:hypothetical protein